MFKSRLLILSSIIQIVFAGFSSRYCDNYGECVIQNSLGTLCYFPGQSTFPSSGLSCSGAGSTITSQQYQAIMLVHLASQHSIGYYDAFTLGYLGDGAFPVPARGVTYLCATGRKLDGTYQSWCGTVTSDNSFGTGYCVLDVGQPYVSDGCYPPDTSAAALSVVKGQPKPVPAPAPARNFGSKTRVMNEVCAIVPVVMWLLS